MNLIATKLIILVNILTYCALHYLNTPLREYALFNPSVSLASYNFLYFIVPSFSHYYFLHLVSNMISFYNTGKLLEQVMSTRNFITLIFILSILSKIIFIIISILFKNFLNFDYYYSHHYSLGFSGIVFGLRYFYYQYDDGPKLIYGMLVDSSKIIWFELFLASFLISNVSFFGHLSGILAAIVINNLSIN
tara:strand:+ start:1472 stop:2044 length:573 start_codon:yes stop_codon:yes gene_type:complete